MTIVQLRRLLEIHGADLSAWPADVGTAARQLVAIDPAAAAAQAEAARLDALIGRAFAVSPSEAAAVEASAGRVMAVLNARALPRQNRAWRWWPAELAAFDFAPAWPRIAALAGVAVLGFAVGNCRLGRQLCRQLRVHAGRERRGRR